ncbi:2-succinyl-5-enolpyruvyl-6-hydroxy-3-cyclohexene-1-carboxylic-acid synthase [Rathayibacter toxicus]|uniref:2-succinyl-5-enolpyruvyl-6-hydroxy-3- cyclohexene-1-carboxylic-acid synthase n=2 Tax=Rathayibacter toxicus TaxID=145458 RepID=UPI0030B8D382
MRLTVPVAGMPDRPPVAPSTRFAVDLLTRFVALGVRDIVVAPGSRSQALALVAAELEARGCIRLHVRIDERSAGFLALGLALESGRPAVVITTSGTATGNLHPAVLEADSSDIPLIAVTTDRPDELRGIRSNQTTEQRELYGPAVRLFDDVPAPDDQTRPETAHECADRAVAAAQHGPVHLNIAFRDPLSSQLAPFEAPVPGSITVNPPAVGNAVTLTAGLYEPLTVVIAGDKAGEVAEAVARAGNWPLLAEISSGARFGPQLVAAWRRLLAKPDFGGRVRRAIVFGHPTLSREVPELLSREDVEVFVVDRGREQFYNPGHRARQVSAVTVVRSEASPRAERAWAGSWVSAGRALVETLAPDRVTELPDGGTLSVEDRRSYARNALAAVRAPLTRELIVAAVWRVTWPHDRLLFGASRLIRVADEVLPGKRITVHSHRGLAGIDGTVSTALGIAIARPGGDMGVTRAVLGDLTLLHEAGGLLLAPGERRPRVQLIVVNDGGGTIFDSLEVASSSPPDAFDRVQFTPQTVDIEALAHAYGWNHRRVTTHGELEQTLTSPGDGPGIVEIPLGR